MHSGSDRRLATALGAVALGLACGAEPPATEVQKATERAAQIAAEMWPGPGDEAAEASPPAEEIETESARGAVEAVREQLAAAEQAFEPVRAELHEIEQALERARTELRRLEDRLARAEERSASASGVSDADLFRLVQRRLLEEPALSRVAIAAEVEEGVVILHGVVPDALTRQAAEAIARSVEGVVAVDSRIEIVGR